MNPGYFKEGNYIYECKSSPEQIDGPINQRSLQHWISSLKKLLRQEQPTAFNYIFPVNRLNEDNKKLLDQLKREFSDDVEIRYYDCDEVDRLINSLDKVGDFPELVKYIQNARKQR